MRNDRLIQNKSEPGQQCRTIIVTGSDAAYFYLAQEMVASLIARRRGNETVGFLDLGLIAEQKLWLTQRGVKIAEASTRLRLGAHQSSLSNKMQYLGRPFLRESFPGFSIYIWLDADTWLQDWSAIETLQSACRTRGAAMVCQNERAYKFRLWLFLWTTKHFILGYGLLRGIWLLSRPHINNGVFALAADAPHWEAWQQHYQRAFDRTGDPAPHDQFSLNAAVWLTRLPTQFVSSLNNWICDLATPMWDEDTGMFCAPYPPFVPISLLHLAGPAKSLSFDVRTTHGSTLKGELRFGAARVIVAGDGWGRG